MFHKVSNKTVLPDFQWAAATLLLDMHGRIKIEDQVKEAVTWHTDFNTSNKMEVLGKFAGANTQLWTLESNSVKFRWIVPSKYVDRWQRGATT